MDDQLEETLLPLFTKDLMEPTTLCTFVFEVCESTTWGKEDLGEYVHYQLAQKSPRARQNNYVQSLYNNIT